MIKRIIKGIFNLIIGLVSTLLAPIDSIISSALPSLASGISAVGSFLAYATSAIGWVLSVFGLSSECLSLIVLYYAFKLTLPLTISTIKLAIRWYDKLKI